MRIQRLFRMMPAEIVYRGWQEAYKTMTRLSTAVSDARYQPPVIFRHLQPSQGCSDIISLYTNGHDARAADALLQRFRLFAPARFFSGTSDELIPDFISADFAAAREQIIASADAICRGQFSILGYGKLSYGNPVDWHLDPVSSVRSPMIHWSRINPLDSAQVGDSKVVWEVNRHQWMLDLGQAYRLTGEEHYAQEFEKLVRGWMQSNPSGIGINWSSSLEVAMRMISWCWGLLLFRDSPTLTPALFADMLGWLRIQANYVERYLSYYFSPNTHLTGEALGLLYVGTLFPEIQGAERWRGLGAKILEDQVPRQIHPDGVYFEQSTRYQYYTIEIYLHYVILARRQGIPVAEETMLALEKMLDFLLSVLRPDGTLPQIGDTDGGWLLPLVRRSPQDVSGLFAIAAALFERPDFAWAARACAPEALWMLGRVGRETFNELAPAPPASRNLQTYPDGGYVIMRNGWDTGAHQLIMDVGPLGCAVSSGHGHADLLSIQCSAFGENYLIDAGTCNYLAGSAWRNYFRSSSAHSTVLVDGRNQAEPSGPFSWHSRPVATLKEVVEQGGMLLADASHNAWSEQDDPVIHRRRVIFVDSSFWVVVDDLSGAGSHQVDLRYQFAPLHVAQESSDWVRARGRRGHAMLVKAFAPIDLGASIKAGSQNPLQGWVSPNYGHRMSAPALSYTGTASLPLRIVTVLYPAQDADAPPPEVTLSIQEGTVTGIGVGDAAGNVRMLSIRDEKISVEEA